MSNAESPSTRPAGTSGAPAASMPKEIRIYGHTALFYWWPVWLLGYILGIVTYFNDSRVLILHSKKVRDADIVVSEESLKAHELLQAQQIPAGTDIRERMHPNKNLGVIYGIVIFLVIIITNVPLRGLSSAVAIVLILFFTVLFAWLDYWGEILEALGRLSVHINMGFYFFFSTVLFIAWALVFFVYDRMSYWRITPGQITHEFVFGGGQTSYDTENMAFKKLRDDLFRHWVLGFGSGDMIMYPLAATKTEREELQVHNVLFVGAKLRRIQEMIAAKPELPRGV